MDEGSGCLSWVGVVAADQVEIVAFLEWFGRLIANTDMHQGNLSFFRSGWEVLEVCPVYDMLPMLYLPQANDLPEWAFSPPTPLPSEAPSFRAVLPHVEAFWSRVRHDPRISEDMQRITGEHLSSMPKLEALARRLPR